MPRVSIYIPAYNAEAFIAEAVASAARQELADGEIVVVDDGSTDRTAEVCRRFGDSVDGVPFRFVANRQNIGGGATRNRCIEVAEGEYLFNLDADNVLPDGLVSALLSEAEARLVRTGERVMVSPETLQYFEDVSRLPVFRTITRRVMRHRWHFDRLDCDFVLTNAESPASSGQYLFHRGVADATGGFFEDCGPFDTWSFGVRAYLAGFRYITVAGTHYLHRLHPESYWVRTHVSNQTREYLWRAIGHFPDVYATQTFEALAPDNPDYPDPPFAALRLRASPGCVSPP